MVTMNKLALLLFAAALTALPAAAKTSTATISESATINPGNTVSVYAVHGTLLTTVTSDAGGARAGLAGIVPLLSIGFELPNNWHFVRRVRWDKSHRTLTIDF